jgi:hypothetical protein
MAAGVMRYKRQKEKGQQTSSPLVLFISIKSLDFRAIFA